MRRNLILLKLGGKRIPIGGHFFKFGVLVLMLFFWLHSICAQGNVSGDIDMYDEKFDKNIEILLSVEEPLKFKKDKPLWISSILENTTVEEIFYVTNKQLGDFILDITDKKGKRVEMSEEGKRLFGVPPIGNARGILLVPKEKLKITIDYSIFWKLKKGTYFITAKYFVVDKSKKRFIRLRLEKTKLVIY